MFELLHAHGVQGPVWETVIVAMSEYATRVLDPWIRTGEIYNKLVDKVIGVKASAVEREALTVDRDYRQDIIARTVVGALTKFQAAMRAGRGWNPCQGAKLRTYFITACLYEFPRIFEEDLRWRRTNQPVPVEYDDINELLEAHGPRMFRSAADPVAAVTDRLMIEDYLATLTGPDRIIVLAVAEGYTHAEIAHLFPSLALTPKAVERRLHRVRKDARLALRSEG
ncbi:RNA polymerase sigma factor [Nocardia lijiangensis]|uniref:RNA polymerase sigma factor n=1 Tax=Nocardia lijiangensis TaxID=299618 RepID=UPI003D70B8FE